jgi:hypothetical protein
MGKHGATSNLRKVGGLFDKSIDYFLFYVDKSTNSRLIFSYRLILLLDTLAGFNSFNIFSTFNSFNTCFSFYIVLTVLTRPHLLKLVLTLVKTSRVLTWQF